MRKKQYTLFLIFLVLLPYVAIFAPDPPPAVNNNNISLQEICLIGVSYLTLVFSAIYVNNILSVYHENQIKKITEELNKAVTDKKYQIIIVWKDEDGTEHSEKQTFEKLPIFFSIPVNHDSETYEK